ncbi:hypothetical protein [Pantoea agglomerans]|uniref:hypothetical protein n=1 Tax=Enterobacter agglomerans TaxID=549 RepID=UPI0005800B39|nr:hypothetical protein [Pantoea agglomerans]KIC86291.1 hypothetical protein RN49_15905 [Pantoea agglomerans]MBA5703257.1 hypothetical protein [Pantoea agglomerans]SUB04284.1 Uncharacterised protein [Pantoea agglomerans]
MTLDKWIALAACVAAFVSALAALLAVKQAGIQRKLSYKPQMLLRPQPFTYEFDNSTLNILNRIKMRDGDSNNSLKSDLAVNIGLGAALDVKIKWNYDSQEIIDNLNDNLIKLEVPLKIERFSNELFTKIVIHNEIHTVFREVTEDSIDYILSYSQKPASTEIIFPFYFLSFICANFIFSIRAGETSFKDFLKPTIKLEYKDIGGESYLDEFYVNIDFIYCKHDEALEKMSGHLSFDKKQSTNKAVRGLKTLRKGYEDFISQYDFNNNR